ncbi:hypothetical protein [Thiocapsa rosea]|uniref:Uncharacterized protein n=1 Tax=Thiocapsa rosea TaxID=69360 RepID=A0A495VI71_9GAMM|nr:hypothetical protein [Thiocapsa rosea]RKT47558.1 hypothetical protein BDD21_5154 [Thiocapsa rosea]
MKPLRDDIVLRFDVHSVDRLLDRDGSPLVGPRIHPEVARAIRADAAGHPKGSRFRITAGVPSGDLGRLGEVRVAIQSHFREECVDAEEEIRALAHKGRWTFLVAFLVVGLVILANEAIVYWFDGRFITVLSESLIIVAWVTLWGPAETLLFSHFPVRRARDLARSLASAVVTLEATEMDPDPPRTS